MIPNRAWFPTNLAERAAWYANFNTQIQAMGASLGLSAGNLITITADNNVMQYIAMAKVEVDAYDEAMREYRRI